MKEASKGSKEHGFVLIASLLILIVVTILGLSLFRGFNVQEQIAGNTREKNRARHAAESALQYAEWWLQQGSNAGVFTNCTGMLNANINQGQVCTNNLSTVVADVTAVPWKAGTGDIGVQYTPPGLTVTGVSGGQNGYYAIPRFYVSLVGPSADGQGTLFRINSMGYGGTPDAVAVLESTYEVGTGVRDLGGQ